MFTTPVHSKNCKIVHNVSLKSKNTFQLDVNAKYYGEVNCVEHLQYLLHTRTYSQEKVLILGGGSNILFTKDFEGLVIKINIKGKKIVSEDSQTIILEVQAGEDWPQLVEFVVSKGWGGIENLAMVPGTTGAAPVQNIACYGHNFHESLLSLDALSVTDGSIRRFSVEECELGYRDSIFKRELHGKYIIISIRLKLSKKPILNTSYKSRYESVEEELSKIASRPYNIKDVYQSIVNIRARKLPDVSKVGSSGSIFKNPVVTSEEFKKIRQICPGIHFYPVNHLVYSQLGQDITPQAEKVKIPAAWLIEDMGWAGKRIGDCGIWEKQPLNIVNYGKATPEELLRFLYLVRDKVYEKYGVLLENEVQII